MSLLPSVLNASRAHLKARTSSTARRHLLTLAIETSCDDTSVAVLEKENLPSGGTKATLHFHKKITSNNTAYNGVHPLAALYSHQENLANLVAEAVQQLPMKRVPDFVSVTRGPGMRSNLFTGIDTAKGLAVAWQKDIVGVHHMQAHALTPRLVAAMQNAQQIAVGSEQDPPKALEQSEDLHPEFPFLSVLASGGHTLLIHSENLTNHTVLGSTIDIAVGECLDKVARAVLPSQILQSAGTTMYGALLEQFAFSDTPLEDTKKTRTAPGIESSTDASAKGRNTESRSQYRLEDNTAHEYRAIYSDRYAYTVSKNHEDSQKQNRTKWGWILNQPLAIASGGLKSKSMEMSFSGLMTAVERVVRFRTNPNTGTSTKISRSPEEISIEERKDLARETMRAAFEHIASRVVLGLQQSESSPTSVVMSGGVAANCFLRYILASTLCAKAFSHVRLIFPPPALCTDNAAMIGWAGLEMYEAGYRDSRSFRALRKWPLDQILSPTQNDQVPP